MAKFERKVERQKSEFTFSKKPPVKVFKFDLKRTLTLDGFRQTGNQFYCLFFDFLIPSLIVIPLLMQFVDQFMAFLIIGHGAITSLLIVVSFYLYNKKKPSIWGLLGRYCFSCLMISAVSFVILLFVLRKRFT